MESKPIIEQQFRCKTPNCTKSFKNASSLFRHNKCCISFSRENPNIFSGGSNDPTDAANFSITTSGIVLKDETFSSSSSNSARDAACLCDPVEEQQKDEVEPRPIIAENVEEDIAEHVVGDDPGGRKMKKQVILNPDGEDSVTERYTLEDLVIDEDQALKLESYSCYAGVPQRDKAGQLFVWVNTPTSRNAELHCVSRHARLYSQLLGRISSATKKMDSKIVSLVNSILEKGHPKNSFDYRGLIQWSFIERLYATKSTEAKKLIQSFSGSASNRMRVIVGLCNASRIGKMRHRYFTVARPAWVSELNSCLTSALLNDFGGERSLRRQFYAQVNQWDGKEVTDDLVESMLFLRLLYLFHELGYFKASQVNRTVLEGGGDSVKWMSYFDEVEALCAVQAAFSDDFSFASKANEGPSTSTTSSSSSSSSSIPISEPLISHALLASASASIPASDTSESEPLKFDGSVSSASVVTEDGLVEVEAEETEAAKNFKKKNMESCWSVHVRAMCKACGVNVKADKDRVCSDAWSSSEGLVELSDADKVLAEKIIRLRNHAFHLWQVFDSLSDRRLSVAFPKGEGAPFHKLIGTAELPVQALSSMSSVPMSMSMPTSSSSSSSSSSTSSADVPISDFSPNSTPRLLPLSIPLPLHNAPSTNSASVSVIAEVQFKRPMEEMDNHGVNPNGQKKKKSKAEIKRAMRDEDDSTFY